MALEVLEQLGNDVLDVVHLGVERSHDRGQARLERAELVRERAGSLALRSQLVLPRLQGRVVSSRKKQHEIEVAVCTHLEVPNEDALEITSGSGSQEPGVSACATRPHLRLTGLDTSGRLPVL